MENHAHYLSDDKCKSNLHLLLAATAPLCMYFKMKLYVIFLWLSLIELTVDKCTCNIAIRGAA
jgi:hypothetical protein